MQLLFNNRQFVFYIKVYIEMPCAKMIDMAADFFIIRDKMKVPPHHVYTLRRCRAKNPYQATADVF